MLSSTLDSLLIGLLLSLQTNADPKYNVLDGANFPDPSIVKVHGKSYAFATNDGAGHNIPVTSNPRFRKASGWSEITDAFPTKGVPAFQEGGWAVEGTTWAPDVNHLTDYDGSFAMYYSPALQSNDAIHCIGLARSQQEAGGAIDASGYLDDDNKRYIVYKIDGPAANNGGYCNSPDNPPSLNTSLMLQRVKHDAATTIGGPVVLYNNQGIEDSYNVEAPTVVKSKDGTYFLFFSFGCYSDNSYATSYVTSTHGIAGPYGKRKNLLQTGDFGLFAPGGADIDEKSGNVVFHSSKTSGTIDDGRVLNTAKILLKGRSASLK
ncbi:hypothetical protein LTR37_017361 [Vermiconidia calcicola]|uniref:Uncharacterized protein n=1 Tax=Vermiconidia calcicola TaxID=1690605 RepID=A0ACC3MK93_9PEZI|nr:hypothetical protein LTR37_017361 [Vermiconidia calcicola]